MRSQGRCPVNMQRTVPLISCELNRQKSKGNIIIQINAPDERFCSPRQIRMLGTQTRLVNLPPGTSMACSPSPWGNHATDCTGQSRSIVFLHTPSCVQIFTARGSLVMIRFPLGDLNNSLLMAPTFQRTLTMQLDQRILWDATTRDGM